MRSAATEQASAHSRTRAADRIGGGGGEHPPGEERGLTSRAESAGSGGLRAAGPTVACPSFGADLFQPGRPSSASLPSARPAHRGRRISSSPPSRDTHRSKQASPLAVRPRSSARRSVPPGSCTPPSPGRHPLRSPYFPLLRATCPERHRGSDAEPVEEPEEQVFGQRVGFGGQYVQKRPDVHGVRRPRPPSRPRVRPRRRVRGSSRRSVSPSPPRRPRRVLPGAQVLRPWRRAPDRWSTPRSRAPPPPAPRSGCP